MTKWNMIKTKADMPTEADGDENGKVWWLTEDGKHVGRWDAHGYRYHVNRQGGVTAWTETGIDSLPVENPPKRRRLWWDRASLTWEPIDRIGDHYRGVQDGVPTAIEVLPGDPDPDACMELLEWLKERNLATSDVTVWVDDMERELMHLLTNCKGGEAT